MMEAELGETGRKITIELDYTHFVKPRGWFLVAQFVLGLLAICCTGAATFPTQIYFLVITIIVFLGSLALSLLHLYFVEFNNQGKIAVRKMSLSNPRCRFSKMTRFSGISIHQSLHCAVLYGLCCSSGRP